MYSYKTVKLCVRLLHMKDFVFKSRSFVERLLLNAGTIPHRQLTTFLHEILYFLQLFLLFAVSRASYLFRSDGKDNLDFVWTPTCTLFKGSVLF